MLQVSQFTYPGLRGVLVSSILRIAMLAQGKLALGLREEKGDLTAEVLGA
jgi:hypothetical protein